MINTGFARSTAAKKKLPLVLQLAESVDGLDAVP
jgi:hypothetical protein